MDISAGMKAAHAAIKGHYGVASAKADARKAMGLKALPKGFGEAIKEIVAKRDQRKTLAAQTDPLALRAAMLPEDRHETIKRRAAERIAPAVLGAYFRAGYRSAEHGHTVTVEVVTAGGPWHARHPEAVSWVDQVRPSTVGLSKAYERKAFWVSVSSHKLRVRPSWPQDVAARGLAVVDGLMTLDARPDLDLDLSGRALAAVWMRQGRGTALVTETGWLVPDGEGGWTHAASERTARILLRQGRQPRRAAPRDLHVEAERRLAGGLTAWTEAERQVPVTMHASKLAGNCGTGTLDWAERHLTREEIDTRRTTVGRVLAAAYQSGDRVGLAVRACVVAVHRAGVRS